MVAMHKALEGQNCFECHKVGEKLMGKGQPKDLNSLLKRRVSASECLPCHGKQE
jgi:mono/diheme cytochrome c family protein